MVGRTNLHCRMIHIEKSNKKKTSPQYSGMWKKRKIKQKQWGKKKKKMRLSRSHPMSLPHSGELFVIGCSRRKLKANIFRIGWDRAGKAGQGLRSIPEGRGGGGLLEESAVPNVLAVRGVSG